MIENKDGHDIVTLQVTCKLNVKNYLLWKTSMRVFLGVFFTKFHFYWIWRSLKISTFIALDDLLKP